MFVGIQCLGFVVNTLIHCKTHLKIYFKVYLIPSRYDAICDVSQLDIKNKQINIQHTTYKSETIEER